MDKFKQTQTFTFSGMEDYHALGAKLAVALRNCQSPYLTADGALIADELPAFNENNVATLTLTIERKDD